MFKCSLKIVLRYSGYQSHATFCAKKKSRQNHLVNVNHPCRPVSQLGFDLSRTASGFIKGTFENFTQETTAPQIISFHRTPQREKHKHRTLYDLGSPQHRKLRFYSPHQKNINTANPHVPLLISRLVALAVEWPGNGIRIACFCILSIWSTRERPNGTGILEDGTNQGVINANEVRRGDPSALQDP